LYEWIRENNNRGKTELNLFSGKKSKYIIVIAICVGLLALIWPSTTVNSGGNKSADMVISKEDRKINQDLASELEYILSRIEGAGKVEVSISLASDGVKTYAANTRNENRKIEENQNGIRKETSESNVTRDLAVSGGAPLLVESKAPEVIGVLVVAEGAGSPLIQEKLIQATATLLNISPHQVCVMPGQL